MAKISPWLHHRNLQGGMTPASFNKLVPHAQGKMQENMPDIKSWWNKCEYICIYLYIYTFNMCVCVTYMWILAALISVSLEFWMLADYAVTVRLCFVEWQGLKTPFIEWKFCTYTVGLSRWQYRFQCINWNPVLLSGNHLTLQKNIVILFINQIYLSTYLSTYQPLCLSTYLPTYLSIYLSTYLPI